jgi:hypothetical protein
VARPRVNFWIFYSANSTEELAYQKNDAYKKKRREKGAEDKKTSVKTHKFTPSSTRGLATNTGEKSTQK